MIQLRLLTHVMRIHGIITQQIYKANILCKRNINKGRRKHDEQKKTSKNSTRPKGNIKKRKKSQHKINIFEVCFLVIMYYLAKFR